MQMVFDDFPMYLLVKCVLIGAFSSPQQRLTNFFEVSHVSLVGIHALFLRCLPLGMDEEVITCSLAKV